MQVLATLAVALNLAGAALALPKVTATVGDAVCMTLYTVTSTYAATATTYRTLGKIPLEVPCGGCDIQYTTIWEGKSVDVEATVTIDSTTTRLPICARTQQAGSTTASTSASAASATASASSSSDSGDGGDQDAPAATSADADTDN
ncbi:hypothetical protein AA313_de0209335 [Arthrobotrys entomopaga]|nr:hypothetical protein AA313_de0209335 [Arthrobotrys entomopaga]